MRLHSTCEARKIEQNRSVLPSGSSLDWRIHQMELLTRVCFGEKRRYHQISLVEIELRTSIF